MSNLRLITLNAPYGTFGAVSQVKQKAAIKLPTAIVTKFPAIAVKPTIPVMSKQQIIKPVPPITPRQEKSPVSPIPIIPKLPITVQETIKPNVPAPAIVKKAQELIQKAPEILPKVQEIAKAVITNKPDQIKELVALPAIKDTLDIIKSSTTSQTTPSAPAIVDKAKELIKNTPAMVSWGQKLTQAVLKKKTDEVKKLIQEVPVKEAIVKKETTAVDTKPIQPPAVETQQPIQQTIQQPIMPDYTTLNPYVNPYAPYTPPVITPAAEQKSDTPVIITQPAETDNSKLYWIAGGLGFLGLLLLLKK